MKKPDKLTLRERNRLIRLQRNNNKKSKRKNKKNKLQAFKNKRQKENVLNLPSNFDLHENPEYTLEAMNYFRSIVDKEKPKLKKLNFEKIKYINSSSALMLAAEIDVWNSKVGNNLQANHDTWNEEIKVLLCEIGFFELLGMTPPIKNQEVNNNTTFLKFISGHKSEGEKAKELREKIEAVIGKELAEKTYLFEGLSEAFTNTTQHAYNKNSNKYDKWWITAAYKKDERKLVVSMYDRGKSIPNTIHKYSKWNEIKTYLKVDLLKSHSHLIKAAMEASYSSNMQTRTQTQQSNRGKGLKQFLDFIKTSGHLTIISGNGYCVFKVKNDKLISDAKKRLKYPLKGTLIEWTINLSNT